MGTVQVPVCDGCSLAVDQAAATTSVLELSQGALAAARPAPIMKVVFIGDSTVRYLFLAVVHLLRKPTDTTVLNSTCTHHCFWNERSYGGSWATFYNDTSTDMWCDCARVGRSMQENRFVKVRGVQLIYLQMFKRREISGEWLPGHPDSERRPHPTYTASWTLNVKDAGLVAGPNISLVVWNIGHHQCLSPDVLQTVHNDLLARVGRQVVFLKTMGTANKDCKSSPPNGETFEDYPTFTNESYWDGRTHLNADPIRYIATRLIARYIGVNAMRMQWSQRNRAGNYGKLSLK